MAKMNYHPYIAALAVPGVVLCVGACSAQNETDAKFLEMSNLNYTICALLMNVNHSNVVETTNRMEEQVSRFEEILNSFTSLGQVLSGSKKVAKRMFENQMEMIRLAESISEERSAEIEAVIQGNPRLNKIMERYDAANVQFMERMKFSDAEMKRLENMLEGSLSR